MWCPFIHWLSHSCLFIAIYWLVVKLPRFNMSLMLAPHCHQWTIIKIIFLMFCYITDWLLPLFRGSLKPKVCDWYITNLHVAQCASLPLWMCCRRRWVSRLMKTLVWLYPTCDLHVIVHDLFYCFLFRYISCVVCLCSRNEPHSDWCVICAQCVVALAHHEEQF